LVEAESVRALERPLHAKETSHLLVTFDYLLAVSLESQIVEELPLLLLSWV
jgi:hypothetical protein